MPPRQAQPRTLPPRLANLSFPHELPIAAHIEDIVRLLRRHQVLIVAGETGSGKTTQLPKACLAAGLGRVGGIAHTQPRRLAARTVAARIAEELGVTLGAEVGYAVRFEDRTSPATVVTLMTDGLLLAELQRDRRLRRYQCVIVDEAHERSLNVDFILGCLKRLLPRRPDLKVVVTSATIDVDAFAGYFDDAPVVALRGRGYPVDVQYLPAAGAKGEDEADNALLASLATIAKDAPAGRRDILVFQSGEREIFDNAQLVKRTFGERFEVLPLYARLPAAQQRRVFAPGPRQRVVLATNVAETSLTVPNIGYVMDPGLARINRYSYRAKLQSLRVEPISQASANQRAGRCGRVAPGVCYRLYTEDDYAARPRYTDPALGRTNLAAVALTMRASRLGDLATFPFIDPPQPRAVRDAELLLLELGAIEDGELTAIGRAMAQLPVDPRLARMLVAAARHGALAEALIIVSVLAAQDPRLRPLDRRAAADQAHARFHPPQGDDQEQAEGDKRASDMLVLLRLWQWLETQRAQHSRREFRDILERHFLSPTRVREWRAVHRQLHLACRDLGMRTNTKPASYQTLHTALLTGALSFIGQRRDPGPAASRAGRNERRPPAEYDGTRGQRFRIAPGSLLQRSPPPWVLAAELSDTGRTYARGVAAVEPAWIEAVAGHIAKSTFSAPRWDPQRGEAIVDERVTVYGLTLVAGRRRRAAEVAPDAARELFVLEALVRRPDAGSANPRVEAPVLDANEALLRRVEARQAVRRRADLVVGEPARCAFYSQRLPADVWSVATWQRHQQRNGADAFASLVMTEQDLAARAHDAVRPEDFPTRLPCAGASLTLAYKFAPGEPDDGVCLRLSPAQLGALDADLVEWLVPGFFADKCLALLKALPKSLRRRLVPLPACAEAITPRLLAPDVYRQGTLPAALSQVLLAHSGVQVPPSAWRLDDVPPHLRMNVQVCRGRRVVDQDRSLAALRERGHGRTAQTLHTQREQHEAHGLTEFPAQGVPASLTLADGNIAYPVLVDRGSTVDLIVQSSPTDRDARNQAGCARLALLAQPALVRRLQRDAERDGCAGSPLAPFDSLPALIDAALLAAAWQAHFEAAPLPSDATAFRACLAQGSLTNAFAATLADARRILAKRQAVAAALDALTGPAFAPSRADLAAQLEQVTPADFLATTPSAWRSDLLRYLDGMALRIERLPGRVRQDRQHMAIVAPWQQRLDALRPATPPAEIAALARLLQEFRIATFAQQLGTHERISAKRLAAHFAAAEEAHGRANG